MIYIKCPHCKATLSVPDEYKTDKRLHCSKCNNDFDNMYKPKANNFQKNIKPVQFSNVYESETGNNKQNNKYEFSLKGKIITTIIIFALAIWGYNACGDSDTTKRSVENAKWDGSVRQVELYLKNNLKDPDSYKSIQWGSVRQQNDGSYVVWHKFRAKNSFGGYVVYWMSFTLDSDGNVIDARTMSVE